MFSNISMNYYCREMCEAVRWHGDPRFRSPMIVHKGAHIFVGDIVEFTDRGEEVPCGQCYGKVLKYMTEVLHILSTIKWSSHD